MTEWLVPRMRDSAISVGVYVSDQSSSVMSEKVSALDWSGCAAAGMGSTGGRNRAAGGAA